MVAVDTNVIVRLLTADDPKQAAAAQTLLFDNSIWIAKTVLAESEWVLRSLYSLTSEEIHQAFVRLLGVANVVAEDEGSVRAALDLMKSGMDFADALHLSSRPSGSTFVTFDKHLVRDATRSGVQHLSVLPA